MGNLTETIIEVEYFPSVQSTVKMKLGVQYVPLPLEVGGKGTALQVIDKNALHIESRGTHSARKNEPADLRQSL